MMERGPSQSAGLSSSPDDDSRVSSIKTEPMSNRQSSIKTETHVSHNELEEVPLEEPSCLWEEEDQSGQDAWEDEQVYGRYDGEVVHQEEPHYDVGDNPNDLGAVGALGKPEEEEIVFEPANNSSSKEDDILESCHSSQNSSRDDGGSFANEDSDIQSNADIPAVWAEDRQGAWGEEPSEEPAGLEYDNVEYQGCMGRLVLTDHDLRFYRSFEEDPLCLPWEEVATRQVSPYGVPMLRIKATKTEHMFRLASPNMANTMREDIKMFPLSNQKLQTSNPGESSTDAPSYKQREHASYLVGGAPPEKPLRPGDVSESQVEDSLSDMDDNSYDEPKTAALSQKKKKQKRGYEDSMAGSRMSRRFSLAESKAEAMRERDIYIKEQEMRERHEKDVKSWSFWTCCCTAILFLVIGGVSGYFIGRETTDKSSKSNDRPAAVAAPTRPTFAPVILPPTKMPALAQLPGSAQEPNAPDESPQPIEPEENEVPTSAPSVAKSNETKTAQPTFRGTPPAPINPPTLEEEEPTAGATEAPTNLDETDATPQPTEQTDSSTGADAPEPAVGGNNTDANSTDTSPAPSLAGDTISPSLSPAPTNGNATVTETPTDDETAAPTAANPTAAPFPDETLTWTPTANTELLALLRSVSPGNGAALDEERSPQQLAHRWMEQEDKISADLDDSKLIQRYSLATFYYSTGGAAVWDASPQARQDQGSWLDPTTDDCSWDFIICNDKLEIVALEMMLPDAPALIGTLPPEIGLFSVLKDFVITGGEAEEAASARKTRQELLEKVQQERNTQQAAARQDEDNEDGTNSNFLTGPLPSEIGNLLDLETLTITNQALSGLLPPEVGNMTSMVSLDLTNNQIWGTVPWEFGYLPSLEQLRLGFNVFQAKIKSKMFEQENGMAQSISGLFLNNNQLCGELPTTLGLLTNIETGLFLEGNRFTGTLPTELGLLTAIKKFRVDTNSLVGEIPSDLRTWNAIEEFQVQGTGLSGEMPGDICRLFLVQGTQSYADCELLECRCCTYCCSNGVCEEA